MNTVNDLFLVAQAASVQAKEAATWEEEIWLEVSRAILSGGTTGDRIRDYVIALRGRENLAEEKRYGDMSSRLKGMTGQLILIPYERQERVRFGIIPQEIAIVLTSTS